MDSVRTEQIRGTAKVGRFEDQVMEARVRWSGHVLRRDDGQTGKRMLETELPGRMRRERRFMDVVKKDMETVGVKVQEAKDKSRCSVSAATCLGGTWSWLRPPGAKLLCYPIMRGPGGIRLNGRLLVCA
ncbi:hypothetical protein AMECASPLE_020296 [Ameca splendens]|uniref:Uncharacterized protein n=1 Tax=Ameca splendens TaxID=208324 RepID=A0ABV0YRC7_9TELE